MGADSSTLLAVGLMSGTSMDGIDAALVRLGRKSSSIETVETRETPFSDEVRRQLLYLTTNDATAEDLCRAGVALAVINTAAVNELLVKAGVSPEAVSVIGYHGQTICHLPQPAACMGVEVRSTLQIGDPSTLAEKTGIAVVSNFRARDMAAGGQGAPLISYFDFELLSDKKVSRVALNIGGIANVTFLPAGAEAADVIAFDTGPGNTLIDLLTFRISGGAERFDRGGEMASKGKVIEPLLSNLLTHPYFERTPPKSTGRGEFGETMLDDVSTEKYDSNDLFATFTAFTARSIALQIEKFWPADKQPGEIVVSGGGVHNKTLMSQLMADMPHFDVVSIDRYGVPSDFKEAIAFAVFADRTMQGLTSSLPSATGATRPVILGDITPAS